ncbi:MAG: hypothetical protein MUE42_09090 [Opitutaceae bacterium]|jgi:hypothetical protein|nr:hypothetical protein [Opitutaceae bacterium]
MSAYPTAKHRHAPLPQELGLSLVVVALGILLAAYGWHDAPPGRPNAFLNFDNVVDGVATPLSYYASSGATSEESDAAYFARLIREAYAAGAFTVKVLDTMTTTMGVTDSEVFSLFQKAYQTFNDAEKASLRVKL